MLEQSSLLTLTGPGGVGKTRIGLRLARVLLDRFDDGAWVVECGSLTDPDFVLPSVVSTIGLTEPAGRSLLAAIVDHLKGQAAAARPRRLRPGPDRAVRSWPRRSSDPAPTVRIVVTSREALGRAGRGDPADRVAGDARRRARPSARHDLGSIDACRLFVERARAVQPAFDLTEPERAVGRPALPSPRRHPARDRARGRARPDAARRADRGASRRPVPAADRRQPDGGRPPPDACGDDRLELRPPDRTGAGGPPAAVGVRRRRDARGGRVRLRRRPGRSAGHPRRRSAASSRSRWSSPIRRRPRLASGCSRPSATTPGLGSSRRTRATPTLRRHRDWYLALVDEASPTFFHGPEPVEWLRRLDREHDDLRAALEWCLDQPGEDQAGLRIAAGLWRYWEIRGHLTEGRGWLERMLEAVGDDVSPLRANALTGAGEPRVHAGRLPRRLDLPRSEPCAPSRAGRSAERRLRRQQPGQHGRSSSATMARARDAVRGIDRA